jgi:hypothetical protein
VQLEGIKAGTRFDWESMRGESYVPGLAVDPAGRAFVGGGRDEPVAEVDLRMLAVILTSPASRTTRWWSDAEMTA